MNLLRVKVVYWDVPDSHTDRLVTDQKCLRLKKDFKKFDFFYQTAAMEKNTVESHIVTSLRTENICH